MMMMRSTRKEFLIKTQFCKLRVTLRSRVLRGVYTLVRDTGRCLSCWRQGQQDKDAQPCSGHENCITRTKGDKTRHLWNSVCMKQWVLLCELALGVGYMGLPGSYTSSCVLPVYVAGQRRSNPGLMLGLLVLSSHDGTCGGRRSLLFRSDLSSARDVMQRYTHLYWSNEDRRVRSGVLHQASGGAHFVQKLFERPSHTIREYTN